MNYLFFKMKFPNIKTKSSSLVIKKFCFDCDCKYVISNSSTVIKHKKKRKDFNLQIFHTNMYTKNYFIVSKHTVQSLLLINGHLSKLYFQAPDNDVNDSTTPHNMNSFNFKKNAS